MNYEFCSGPKIKCLLRNRSRDGLNWETGNTGCVYKTPSPGGLPGMNWHTLLNMGETTIAFWFLNFLLSLSLDFFLSAQCENAVCCLIIQPSEMGNAHSEEGLAFLRCHVLHSLLPMRQPGNMQRELRRTGLADSKETMVSYVLPTSEETWMWSLPVLQKQILNTLKTLSGSCSLRYRFWWGWALSLFPSLLKSGMIYVRGQIPLWMRDLILRWINLGLDLAPKFQVTKSLGKHPMTIVLVNIDCPLGVIHSHQGD